MFRRKNPSIQLGDQFIKAGDPHGKVWVVVRLWTPGDGIPHARMKSTGHQCESRVISLSALTDPHFFKPAVPAAAE